MKDEIDVMREVHEADQAIGLRGADAVVQLLESRDPGRTYYANLVFLSLQMPLEQIFSEKNGMDLDVLEL